MKPYSKAEAIRYLEKHKLYIMKPASIDRFVSCGVEAFKGTSIYDYFFNGKDYDKKITLAMELLVKTTGKNGLLYADSEKVNGFAQWFPPGFTGHSLFNYAFSGGWKYIFMSKFFQTVNRIDYIENYAFKRKTEITQNQDIFLYYLAVRPSMQRKGIARKLINPMLEYAKSINRPCYCETYVPSNITVYEHMGFTQFPSSKVPDTQEIHYPMLYKVH